MYKPNSLWTWSFTIIVAVQLVSVLGLESCVLGLFENNLLPVARGSPYSRSIPTFLTLFIFGLFYQLILVWDALRLKNTIQVIGLCIYNVLLLIYAGTQIEQIQKANTQLDGDLISENLWPSLRPYLIAIPCIISLCWILMSFVAWKLYDEFAWTIYKHISADLQMKRRYLTFQIYIALLKFDFFFFLGFTIQFLVIVVQTSDVEFALTIAAIPVSILILLMAAFFTRRENKAGMGLIMFLFTGALAYFIFKLARMYHGPKVPDYLPARNPLTVFAVLTILLIILTIFNAIACMMNFGKGLRPYITSRKVESEDEKGYVTEMPNLAHGPGPSRMTIE